MEEAVEVEMRTAPVALAVVGRMDASAGVVPEVVAVAGRGSSHAMEEAVKAFPRVVGVDQEEACIPFLEAEAAWDAYAAEVVEERTMPAAAVKAVAAAGAAVASTSPVVVDTTVARPSSTLAVVVAAAAVAPAAADAAHPQSALSFLVHRYHRLPSSPSRPALLHPPPPPHSPNLPRPRPLHLPSPLSPLPLP